MSATEGRQLSLFSYMWCEAMCDGRREEVGAEPRGLPAPPTRAWITEAEALNAITGNTRDLLERVCERGNMLTACDRVVRNAGAGGVDGMDVSELPAWLEANCEALTEAILSGTYRPDPVRRAEIPKEEKGKTRLLGIPTVRDRLVQQALVQQLTPIFEPTFHEDSYGFRPGRSAHDALRAVLARAEEGNVWVASMDLERFFDTVNQSKLVQLLSDRLADRRVVSLIHRFLRAGVVVDGIFEPTEEGTCQGGPLSPLLANILLNELDWELERRGHVFVRYADDFIILKRSKKAAERAMESIARFVEEKLFLKVNREKSYVARITKQVKYLGHSFYAAKGGEVRLCVHAKSYAKLKDKVREALSRSNGQSYEWRMKRLREIINGWVGYFRHADMRNRLDDLDRWMRRKIRCVYWKCWKRVRTKFRELMRLGISRDTAFSWACSRKSYWRVAGSGILDRALNNARLEEMGWPMLLPRYLDLQRQV